MYIGSSGEFTCSPGFVYKSALSSSAPVRSVSVVCASSAARYDQTRGHHWREEATGQAVGRCVPG